MVKCLLAPKRLTAWLIEQGIKPLIAHPERNKGLLRSPAKLKPFLEQGCLLQVTAGAVPGRLAQQRKHSRISS